MYAFGRGMDPRAKDGVRAHPLVLVGGTGLHAGIAAAIVTLALVLFRAPIPFWTGILLIAAQSVGAACGLALLSRRLVTPVLQAISVADDYLSNVLVLMVLVTGIASIVSPNARTSFLIAALVLALYAPFGKIRHCLLFFVARGRYGLFVGRRGLFRHSAQGAGR